MKDEISDATPKTDLLGDPVDQRDELIGAPKFEISEQKQLLVATLRSTGWTQDRIATYIGCDAKTLRKHFSRELAEAGDLIEGKALEVIVAKMLDGNVSAARRMQDLVEKGRASPPLPTAPRDDAAPADKPAKQLGKKEETAAAARNPGATWGDLLDPNRPN